MEYLGLLVPVLSWIGVFVLHRFFNKKRDEIMARPDPPPRTPLTSQPVRRHAPVCKRQSEFEDNLRTGLVLFGLAALWVLQWALVVAVGMLLFTWIKGCV